MDDIETEFLTVGVDLPSNQYGHILSMSIVLLLSGSSGRHCSAQACSKSAPSCSTASGRSLRAESPEFQCCPSHPAVTSAELCSSAPSSAGRFPDMVLKGGHDDSKC